MLLGTKAPGVQIIASGTFIAILMTVLIQATPPSGRRESMICWWKNKTATESKADNSGKYEIARPEFDRTAYG